MSRSYQSVWIDVLDVDVDDLDTEAESTRNNFRI